MINFDNGDDSVENHSIEHEGQSQLLVMMDPPTVPNRPQTSTAINEITLLSHSDNAVNGMYYLLLLR